MGNLLNRHTLGCNGVQTNCHAGFACASDVHNYSARYSPAVFFAEWNNEFCMQLAHDHVSNERIFPTQHVTTLLGATCCVRLATVFCVVG